MLGGGASRGDVLGALTAWALIVPECVAYAQIAGVPPQNAFYAAPVALVAYVLLGRSRFLIIGATSAAAVLSGATVADVSSDPKQAVGLSAALAVLAGAVLLVAGLARLGFVTNFLAEPALNGFLFGMALTIVVRQAAKIAGTSSGDGQFFPRLWTLLRHFPHWSLTSLAVGAAALAALLAIERYAPKAPASLVVLVVALVVSAGLDLKQHGVEVVGKIPSAVPVPHLPGIPAADWGRLAGGACGVALVVFAEAFSIASRFAREHGDEVDADREMAAVGASNIAVGLFRGFTVSGSASRSAAASTTRLSVLGKIPGSPLYGDTDRNPGATTVRGVLVVRPDGALFFGNANRTRLGLLALTAAAHPPPHTVVLDLSATYHLGVPVLDTLDELREALHHRGATLHLARLRAAARRDFDRHPLATRLGRDRVHRSVEDAMTATTAAEPPSSPRK